jgi:murein DD-endopeptidase MepM/ murein hydrolase activator NlpD
VAAFLLYTNHLPAAWLYPTGKVWYAGALNQKAEDSSVDLSQVNPLLNEFLAPALELESEQADVPAITAAVDSAQTISPFSPASPVTPVGGRILRARGWYRHEFYGDWRLQPGIKLEAAPGEPVRAAYAGVVQSVMKSAAGDTWIVVIQHDDSWSTEYAGLGWVSVQPQMKVAAGDEIGTTPIESEMAATSGGGMGIDGSTGGAGIDDRGGLHFVLRRHGEAVDPATYLFSSR